MLVLILLNSPLPMLSMISVSSHTFPELIDNVPTTAPSKRIIKAIEGDNKYKYNKPSTGKSVTKEIGIDELRARISLRATICK